MAQVPDNLRSRAEKLSGRWSQKLPPRMRNRGNTKGIVSEDSKIASLSLQGFLGAGREASVFVGAGGNGGGAGRPPNQLAFGGAGLLVNPSI